MSELRQIAIQRALKALGNMGCKFAVIDVEGNKYGELEVTEIKKRRASVHEHGSLTKHIKPYLTPMNPGDVVVIPIDSFEPKSLSSALSSYAHSLWGKGSSTYCRRDNTFELLRIL
jgi:hypothetical protein